MSDSTITKLILRQKSSETYSVCIPNLPADTLVAKALLLVKASVSDGDGDAVISKTIYPGSTADGQITDQGADGTAQLYFVIDNDDVDPLSTSQLYFSAVKVILDNGLAYQPPYTRRPVRVLPPVIDAVS